MPRPYYLYFHVPPPWNPDQEAFAKRPGSRGKRLEWIAVKADLAKPSRPLDAAKRQSVFQHRDRRTSSTGRRISKFERHRSAADIP